jgi:hypothetical protein
MADLDPVPTDPHGRAHASRAGFFSTLLGHESFTTTERHYARPEAIAAAQQEGALRELERNLRPVPRAA